MKTNSARDYTQPLSLHDAFSEARSAGQVIGSAAEEGVVRRGVDVEGALSIDHGALRIRPLSRPGWGRAGLAYGPFERQDGLAFGVWLLNGHNTSQTGKIERFDRRIRRWIKGSGTDGIMHRLQRWPQSRQSRGTGRRLWMWFRDSLPLRNRPHFRDNLTTGWFSEVTPQNPISSGNAFVIHALGPENGLLGASVAEKQLPAVQGLQNVPLYLLVVLRQEGAAYYSASIPGAKGCASYPSIRPLAIDPFGNQERVFAGLFQSVMGEAGFRVDTRVYDARVELVPQWADWFGSAHAADSLAGSGRLEHTPSETGSRWTVVEGSITRSQAGAAPGPGLASAVLEPHSPSGLVHLLISTAPDKPASAGIMWRTEDDYHGWRCLVDDRGCRVQVRDGQEWQTAAESGQARLEAGQKHSLQLLDDGRQFQIYLDGQAVFASEIEDTRFSDCQGVGFVTDCPEEGLTLQHFEAHPRTLALPDCLLSEAPWFREGNQALAADTFAGPAGELSGRETSFGEKVWRKEIGRGRIAITGKGTARVDAEPSRPNPGRTAYTIPWEDQGFADIQVRITPPGSGRGQGEKGRGGLIFWQDAENYLIVNNWLDDMFDGSSISSFFYLWGCEEVFDAVWTNVGSRLTWGQPHTLRVSFDGIHYIAWVNDEPVLYRSLTDVYPDAKHLAIHRVGIVANWEWGDDTGSLFEHFLARRGDERDFRIKKV